PQARCWLWSCRPSKMSQLLLSKLLLYDQCGLLVWAWNSCGWTSLCKRVSGSSYASCATSSTPLRMRERAFTLGRLRTQGIMCLDNSQRTIRAFQPADAADVVDVWHRSGRAAYPFIPTWQAFTLEQAHWVFENIIRPHCAIWVATRNERVVAYLAMQ